MPILPGGTGAYLNEVGIVFVGKDVEPGFEPSLPSPFGSENNKTWSPQYTSESV